MTGKQLGEPRIVMEDYRCYIVQWLWLKVKNWTKPNDHDQGSTQWPSHYLAFLCELLGTVASAKAKLKPALAFLHLFSPWMLTPLQRWNTIWFVLTLLGNKVREWNGLFGCFLKDSDQEIRSYHHSLFLCFHVIFNGTDMDSVQAFGLIVNQTRQGQHAGI